MYIVFAKNTPYGTNIIMHRQINMDDKIAERHVERLNALKVGQGRKKQAPYWSWGNPAWFQQQLDEGKLKLVSKGKK